MTAVIHPWPVHGGVWRRTNPRQSSLEGAALMDKRETRPHGPRVFVVVEMVANGLACFFGKGRRWDWRCAFLPFFMHVGLSACPHVPGPAGIIRFPRKGSFPF